MMFSLYILEIKIFFTYNHNYYYMTYTSIDRVDIVIIETSESLEELRKNNLYVFVIYFIMSLNTMIFERDMLRHQRRLRRHRYDIGRNRYTKYESKLSKHGFLQQLDMRIKKMEERWNEVDKKQEDYRKNMMKRQAEMRKQQEEKPKITLSSEKIDELYNKLVAGNFLAYGTTWCGWSKRQLTLLKELFKEHDVEKIMIMDGEAPEGVTGFPAWTKEGKVVESGFRDEEKLVNMVEVWNNN